MESKEKNSSVPQKEENNEKNKEDDNKMQTKTEKNEENDKKVEDQKESHKLEKIKLPKRKFAIIHGYFGQDYSGNTKNPGVKTVEEELENALYKEKFISECNYGKLTKISWMRASRTDKGVSAIMNVVSAKLHKHPNMSELDMKQKLNEVLPKDIRVFRIIEVSDHFDSKDNNNNREYHYILPTFLLEPKKEEEKKDNNDNKINENNGNAKEEEINIPDDYKANYDYRLTEEDIKKLKEICKGFLGTKKFHNYTRKVGFSNMSSQRHIIEMNCDDIIDFGVFQVIKFKIIGQSFLYNQIRKMIGMIIDCMRNQKDMDYFKNSFLSNKYDIPKAPGEGLYLRNIDYSKYNDRKLNKKNNIFLTDDDEREMEAFREKLVEKIKDTELKQKVFTSWLWKFDNKREWIIN
jgi:tRNA pseudouridine38-40 synthase